MSDCPRCDTDITFPDPGLSRCPSCGLRYIGVQEGETWSDDEHQVAVWETDVPAVKSFYGVTEKDFES